MGEIEKIILVAIGAVLSIPCTIIANSHLSSRSDRKQAKVLKVNLWREIKNILVTVENKKEELEEIEDNWFLKHNFKESIECFDASKIDSLLENAGCLPAKVQRRMSFVCGEVHSSKQRCLSKLRLAEAGRDEREIQMRKFELFELFKKELQDTIIRARHLVNYVAKIGDPFLGWFRFGLCVFFLSSCIGFFLFGRATASTPESNLVHSELPGGFEIGHSVNNDNALALYFGGGLMLEPKPNEKHFEALAGVLRELEGLAGLTSPTLTLGK